jgi:hypothetical protein
MNTLRTFLEPADGADSYVAVYNVRGSTDITLKIADCDRNVKLSFGVNKKDQKYYLRKLKKLQSALEYIEKELKKKK